MGAAPPPPTEAALLSGRRPLAGWAGLTSFLPDGLGGFPVGLRPRVREHVAARSSGGGAGRGRDTLPSTLLRTGSPTWPSPWPWAASQAAGGRVGSASRLGSRASTCAHSTAAARPLRGEGEGTPRSRLPLSSPGAVRVRADGGGRGGERHPAGPAPVRPAAEDAAGPPSPGVCGHPNPGLLPFTFQKTKTPVPAGRLLAGGLPCCSFGKWPSAQ